MKLLMEGSPKSKTVNMIAVARIIELKRELARANQRIGLFQHHASKKKKAKR
jgi:hypothetical protein